MVKKMTFEEDETRIRQIGLTSLNESIMVSSTDPKEDMEYLSKLAVHLFHEIRKRNGEK